MAGSSLRFKRLRSRPAFCRAAMMDKIVQKTVLQLATLLGIAAMLHAWAPGIGEFATPIGAPIVACRCRRCELDRFAVQCCSMDLYAFRVSGRIHGRAFACSGSARREIFLRRSKRSPSGSEKGTPRWQRGIFNAGPNVGALATPLLVPAIVLAWGGTKHYFHRPVGFIWLVFWLVIL